MCHFCCDVPTVARAKDFAEAWVTSIRNPPPNVPGRTLNSKGENTRLKSAFLPSAESVGIPVKQVANSELTKFLKYEGVNVRYSPLPTDMERIAQLDVAEYVATYERDPGWWADRRRKLEEIEIYVRNGLWPRGATAHWFAIAITLCDWRAMAWAHCILASPLRPLNRDGREVLSRTAMKGCLRHAVFQVDVAWRRMKQAVEDNVQVGLHIYETALHVVKTGSIVGGHILSRYYDHFNTDPYEMEPQYEGQADMEIEEPSDEEWEDVTSDDRLMELSLKCMVGEPMTCDETIELNVAVSRILQTLIDADFPWHAAFKQYVTYDDGKFSLRGLTSTMMLKPNGEAIRDVEDAKIMLANLRAMKQKRAVALIEKLQKYMDDSPIDEDEELPDDVWKLPLGDVPEMYPTTSVGHVYLTDDSIDWKCVQHQQCRVVLIKDGSAYWFKTFDDFGDSDFVKNHVVSITDVCSVAKCICVEPVKPQVLEEMKTRTFTSMFDQFAVIFAEKARALWHDQMIGGKWEKGDIIRLVVDVMMTIVVLGGINNRISAAAACCMSYSSRLLKNMTVLQRALLQGFLYALWELSRAIGDHYEGQGADQSMPIPTSAPELKGDVTVADLVDRTTHHMFESDAKHRLREAGFYVAKRVPHANATMSEGLRALTNAGRAASSLTAVERLATTVLNYGVALKEYVEGTSPEIRFKEIMMQYNEMLMRQPTTVDIHTLSQMIGEMSVMSYGRNGLAMQAKTAVNAMLSHRAALSNTLSTTADTKEAFVMLLYGEAGCGKTQNSVAIMNAIYRGLHNGAPMDRGRIFDYDPRLSYYDHYRGQSIFRADDGLWEFGNSEEGRNGRSRFLNLCNGKPVLLPVAECDRKAWSYAQMEGMLVMANDKTLMEPANVDDEARAALRRRVKLVIQMRKRDGVVQWCEEGTNQWHDWMEDYQGKKRPVLLGLVYDRAKVHDQQMSGGVGREIMRVVDQGGVVETPVAMMDLFADVYVDDAHEEFSDGEYEAQGKEDNKFKIPRWGKDEASTSVEPSAKGVPVVFASKVVRPRIKMTCMPLRRSWGRRTPWKAIAESMGNPIVSLTDRNGVPVVEGYAACTGGPQIVRMESPEMKSLFAQYFQARPVAAWQSSSAVEYWRAVIDVEKVKDSDEHLPLPFIAASIALCQKIDDVKWYFNVGMKHKLVSLAKISAFVAAMTAVVMAIRWAVQKVEPQGYDKRAVKTGKPKDVKKPYVPSTRMVVSKHEGQADGGQPSTLESMRSNMMTVRFDPGTKKGMPIEVCSMLIELRGKYWMVIPMHLMTRVEDTPTGRLIIAGKGSRHEWKCQSFLEKSEYYGDTEMDIALVNVPLSANQLPVAIKTSMLCVTSPDEPPSIEATIVNGSHIRDIRLNRTRDEPVKYQVNGYMYRLSHCVTYDTDLAVNGACGSVVFCNDKVHYVHVAGVTGKRGVAVPVSVEMLDSMLDGCQGKDCLGTPKFDDVLRVDPTFSKVMRDDVRLDRPWPRPKSDLVKLSTHGVLAKAIGYDKPLEVPAHHGWVSDEAGWSFYPLEALRKYPDRAARDVKLPEGYEEIMYRYGRKIAKLMPPGWKPCIRSLREAITGGDFESGHVDPIVLNTSAGLMGNKSGLKSDFIRKNVQNQVEWVDPLLEQLHKECIERLVGGDSFYAAMDFESACANYSSKVETRPPGKLPRGIHGVSAPTQLVWRSFTMEISAMRKRNPWKLKSGVGTNPHSQDWDIIHQHMDGRKVFMCDVDALDASVCAEAMEGQWHMYRGIADELGVSEDDPWRIGLLGPDDHVGGLCYHLVIARVAFGKAVFEWKGTILSGLPDTSLIGGDCERGLLTLAAKHALSLSTEAAEQQVSNLMFYGDDSIGASPWTAEQLERVVFTAASFGLVMTNPDKTGAPTLADTSDAEFLGRKFRKDGHVVYAPMRDSTFANMLCYRDPRQTEATILVSSVIPVVGETALRGDAAVLLKVQSALTQEMVRFNQVPDPILSQSLEEILERVRPQHRVEENAPVWGPYSEPGYSVEESYEYQGQGDTELQDEGSKGQAKPLVPKQYKIVSEAPVTGYLVKMAEKFGPVGDSMYSAYKGVMSLFGMDHPMAPEVMSVRSSEYNTATLARPTHFMVICGKNQIDPLPHLPETSIQWLCKNKKQIVLYLQTAFANTGDVFRDLPVAPGCCSGVDGAGNFQLYPAPPTIFSLIFARYTFSAVVVTIEFDVAAGVQNGIYRIAFVPMGSSQGVDFTTATNSATSITVDVNTAEKNSVSVRLPNHTTRPSMYTAVYRAGSSVIDPVTNDLRSVPWSVTMQVLQPQTTMTGSGSPVGVTVSYSWEDIFFSDRSTRFENYTESDGTTYEGMTYAAQGDTHDSDPTDGGIIVGSEIELVDSNDSYVTISGVAEGKNLLETECFGKALMTKFSVSATATAATISLPKDYYNLASITAKLYGIQFIRNDFRVELSLSSASSTVARVVMAAIPYGLLYRSSLSGMFVVDRAMLEQFPHVSFSTSTSRYACLHLKWNGVGRSMYQLSMQSQADLANDRLPLGWVIVVKVFNPTNPAGQTPFITGNVYVTPLNVRTHVHAPSAYVAQGVGDTMPRDAMVELDNVSTPDISTNLKYNHQGMMVSDVRTLMHAPHVFPLPPLNVIVNTPSTNFTYMLETRTNLPLFVRESSLHMIDPTAQQFPINAPYALIMDMFAAYMGSTDWTLIRTDAMVATIDASGGIRGRRTRGVILAGNPADFSLTSRNMLNSTILEGANYYLSGFSHGYAHVRNRWSMASISSPSISNEDSEITMRLPYANTDMAVWRPPTSQTGAYLSNDVNTLFFSDLVHTGRGVDTSSAIPVQSAGYDAIVQHADDWTPISYRPVPGIVIADSLITTVLANVRSAVYTLVTT